MAFDFGALVAGFSTGAAESIESRNKQIRNGATKELDQLVQEASAKEKGLKTERDTLSEQAKQLSTYVNAQGVGFTKSQILGLIQQPPVAKKLIEDLNNKKDLRDVDFASIFKVTKPGTEMEPEEFVRKKTSIAVDQDMGKPTPVVRGAFGFESPGVAQAEKEFQTVSGRTAAEVRSIARGRIDMGEDFKPTEGTIDLSQFGNPEAITSIQDKLAINMSKGIPVDDPKNAPLLKRLQANAVIKDMFTKDKGDTDKPRSTDAIVKVLTRTTAVAVDPFVKSGVVRLVPETNEYVVIGGTAAQIDAFAQQRAEVVRKQLLVMGEIDETGKLRSRNAFDAASPIFEIKDGKIGAARKPSKESTEAASSMKAQPSTAVDVPSTPAQPRSVVFKDKNIPEGMNPEVWNMMTPEQKALFAPKPERK